MIAVPIEDASAVADARRAAAALAEQNGFGDVDTGRVALVATELGTNIVKHGGGGADAARHLSTTTPARAWKFWCSTAVPGWAMSRPACATAIRAAAPPATGWARSSANRAWSTSLPGPVTGPGSWRGSSRAGPAARAQASHAAWGAVAVPMPGEEVCGDSWSVHRRGTRADFIRCRRAGSRSGSGGGLSGSGAPVPGVSAVTRSPTLLDYVHGGLRATRGAAVSIAQVEFQVQERSFLPGSAMSPGWSVRMDRSEGWSRCRERRDIMRGRSRPSNTLRRRRPCHPAFGRAKHGLTPGRYPSLDAHHPTLIAGILYRDFARGRDDATVLVGKWGRPVRSMP